MSELKLKNVLVTEKVLLHQHHRSGEPCNDCCGGCRPSTASFLVNIETGECEGAIVHATDIVQVDPVWWKKHCARVGARVHASFKDHVI
jgi:hypothetical protein